MFLFYSVSSFILGTVLGSFISAIIYREQNNTPWFSFSGKLSRSYCPKCDVQLHVKDLIPLFSWVFQRGKCRYCGHRISLSYPVLELVSGLFIVMFYWRFENMFATYWYSLFYPFVVSFCFLLFKYKFFSKRLFFCVLGLFFLSFPLMFLIYPIMR